MSEFKVIESQEELDKVIQKRLERNTREVEERYKDYMSPDDVSALKGDYETKIKAYEEKIAGNDAIVAELTTRATTAETKLIKTNAANKNGIPLELASRLQGSSEEEIDKDAQAFASLLKPKTPAPLFTGEPAGTKTDSKEAALMQLRADLDKTKE